VHQDKWKDYFLLVEAGWDSRKWKRYLARREMSLYATHNKQLNEESMLSHP
jgi:hypothetical protein